MRHDHEESYFITNPPSLEKSPTDPSFSFHRDWNEEFQSILDKITQMNRGKQTESKDEKLKSLYSDLATLANDFVFVSSTYGKVIITEKFLPQNQRTIQAVTDQLHGIAGGDKYIVHGILFKFANDNLGLYRGVENAMKASSLDLLGCASVLSSPASEIRVPLMCVIDYRGFRVTAMTLLPIDGLNTLVYGSSNALKTVRNEDPVFQNSVKVIANHLNLKEHVVQGVPLWTGADVEGHKGHDGRYYMIDFSRLFPPESPKEYYMALDSVPLSESSPSISFLYKILRPELVRSHQNPLSSDAFSKFCLDDQKLYDYEVGKATYNLYKYDIPRFCYWLCIQEKFEPDMYPIDPEFNVAHLLHSFGINIRHCYFVYRFFLVLSGALPTTSQVEVHYVEVMKATIEYQSSYSSPIPLFEKAKNWASIFLIEMVSRTIKCLIRRKLRQRMKELPRSAEEPYRRVIIENLNHYLLQFAFIKRYQKFENRAIALENENLKILKKWSDLALLMYEKFQIEIMSGIPEDMKEIPSTVKSIEALRRILNADNLYQTINRRKLYFRLKQMLGLIFVPEVDLERSSKDVAFQYPLDVTDLLQAKEIVKDMSIVPFATGKLLQLRAKGQVRDRAQRFLNLAIREFLSTVGDWKALWTSQDLSQCYYELAIRFPVAWKAKKLLKQSEEALNGPSALRITAREIESSNAQMRFATPGYLPLLAPKAEVILSELIFKKQVHKAADWCSFKYKLMLHPKGLAFDVALGYANLKLKGKNPARQKWSALHSLLAFALTSSGEVRIYSVFQSKEECDYISSSGKEDPALILTPQDMNQNVNLISENQMHVGPVNCLKLLGCRFLITGGDALDCSIVVFDLKKQNIIFRKSLKQNLDSPSISNHVQSILCLDAFISKSSKKMGGIDSATYDWPSSRKIPPNSFIAFGTSEGDVNLMRLIDGELMCSFKGHSAPVKKVLLACIYSATSQSQKTITPLSISDNLDEPRSKSVIISCSADNSICFWNIDKFFHVDNNDVQDSYSNEQKEEILTNLVEGNQNQLKDAVHSIFSSPTRKSKSLSWNPLGLSFNSKKKHKEKNDHLDDEVEEVYGRPGCILEISTLNSGSHRSPVECIALAGNYLVSGSEDHTIRIWRIYRANRKDSEDSEKKMQLIAQCIHILEGHCDSIMNLRFSPSYNILFSASADSTIRMWYVPPFDDECFFDEYKDPSNPDSPTVSRARSLSRSRGEIVNPFCIRVLEGHSSEVISLDIIEWPSPKEISSPKEKDGNESSSSLRITILSGSTDGYLGLWHF